MRATRAQADRLLYKAVVRQTLENYPNLKIFQQACDDLVMDGDRVAGVVTQSGIRISGKTVVLTVGTFLNGLIHIGMENYKGVAPGILPRLPSPSACVKCRCASIASRRARHHGSMHAPSIFP